MTEERRSRITLCCKLLLLTVSGVGTNTVLSIDESVFIPLMRSYMLSKMSLVTKKEHEERTSADMSKQVVRG